MAETQLDRIRAQFTRQADAYAEMEQTRDRRGHAALVALADTQPTDDVLDVACGPGFLTMAFAERCSEAIGLDATDHWLGRASAEAARRGLANVRFQAGDATALPFPDARFDVVACRAAFHHFPEPARVLAELVRVAKPGARLVIADMLGSEDPARAARHDAIEQLCDPTHVRAIPASEWSALFAAAGLAAERNLPGEMAYDLEEWMAHGGPDAAAAGEIRARMEASLADDATDLAVARVDGRLRFRHRVAVFVLRRPR
jgi:ubiquinone/menaquinone biosynthesis C-methylase UbiE